MFADSSTLTHTHVHTKNITPPPALLWLWQNSNLLNKAHLYSHLASEKLRYRKQSLSPCGKAKNRMHLDIRSKQRSIPALKCAFECTFHKTSLKKTKMPQLICADTRRHTDTHRHAHTNAHCTKHTIHSILRHVAEIKHADASQWHSKTHTHTHKHKHKHKHTTHTHITYFAIHSLHRIWETAFVSNSPKGHKLLHPFMLTAHTHKH